MAYNFPEEKSGPGKVQVFLPPWFCMSKIIQKLVMLQVQYKTYMRGGGGGGNSELDFHLQV